MTEPFCYFDAFTCFGPKPGLHSAQPYRLEQIIDEMRHCSIAAALVTSTACWYYDPMYENLRLSRRLADIESLFPIWTVIPHATGEFPAPGELTEQMRRHDVRAVMICPNNNAWNLRSRTSRPLLDELQRTAVLTVIDMRTEITAVELEWLVETYPNLPVLLIGVHWGKQRVVLPLLLEFKNLHVAFDQLQINYGLEWLVEHGAEDQLIFASNAADMSMGAHRAYVDYADIPPAAKAKVASGNLTRLLKNLAPPPTPPNDEADELMIAAAAGEPLGCEVLDFHTHVLDEGLNGAGAAYTMLRGGPKGISALASRMGVDALGLMSWNGTVGLHADEGNECTRAALDAMGPGCWGLATFDPVHDTPEQVRAKMDAVFTDDRFCGLKPYVRYGKHYDDPAYDVWWEFASERGLYALLHPNRGDLSEFDVLCPKYPNVIFVAPHCGGSYAAADAAIDKARKYPNFYAEITLTPVCLGVIDYLVAGCGAERVLYGSDQPMRDPRPQLGWVVYSRLSVADKKKVLGANARSILERLRTAR